MLCLQSLQKQMQGVNRFFFLLFIFQNIQGHFNSDFDVTLIGFNSKTHECSPDSTVSDFPSLIWHLIDRSATKSIHVGLCEWPSKIWRSAVDAVIKDVLRNSTIRSLQDDHLVCVAMANRYTPQIIWKSIPNMVLSPPTQRIPSLITSRRQCRNVSTTISILRIDNRSVTYQCSIDKKSTCSVENQCERRSLLVRKTVLGDRGYINSTSTSMCTVLTSGPCASVLANDTRLVTFPNRMDEMVTRMRMQMKSRADFWRMCYLLYPSCYPSASAEVLPLCKEDCYMLQNGYWQNWATLSRYVANQYQDFQLDGCAQMPSIMDEASKCAQAANKAFRKEKLRVDCYEENDRHYVGVVNRTETGHVCQRWDSLCPHDHDYWPELYPELRQAENYCRNPNGVHSRPWCYTTDQSVPIAFCTIPPCPLTVPVNQESENSNRIPLFVAFGAGLVFSASALLIYVCKRRWTVVKAGHSVRFTKASMESGLDEDMVTLGQDIPQNELYYRNDRGLDRRLEPLEVARTSWTVIRRLASGENNDIFLARLNSLSHRRQMRVVKVLKNADHRPLFDSFVHEACLVSSCQHHRIVSVLGVGFLTEPTCILFEYMPLGDLKTLLEAEGSQNGDDQFKWLENYRKNWDPPLNHPRRQLDICYQVADGMVYLGNRRIVHRDLAARNVLVDEKMQTKISDFGLSKRVDRPGGQHVSTESERLPVRWTAPEAWSRRHFSAKSDVWSFGVLIWEILSLGMQPYMGCSHQQVVDMVVNLRETLQVPKFVTKDSEEIGRELMEPCFEYDPENRPDFIELMAKAAMLRERLQ